MNKTADVTMSASGFNYIAKSSYFESKHKSRPSHFSSVVEGRLKRTERKSLHRKSARISTFDNARNMSPQQSASPVTLTAVQVKSQRRRLLLQQWKEEKERKKLENAKTQKKKPFVVGTVHAPLAFEPPPVAPKPKPSTSGRVTRSQSLRNKSQQAPVINKNPSADSRQGRTLISAADFFANLGKNNNPSSTSFAPPNAVFHPPKLEMNFILPPVQNNRKNRTIKQSVTFDPVVKTSHSAPIQKSIKKTNDHQKSQILGNSSQPRAPNQKTETKLGSSTVQMQQVGVLAPKENNHSNRVTRRNTRITENQKVIESKQTDIKPQAKEKSKKVKEIAVRSHNTPKKRATKVPKSESSVEDILRTPPQDQVSTEVERSSTSPCVTISRGKRNARKETIDKLKCGLLGDDVGDGKTVDDFRLQLNSEIKRLTAISDEWHQYAEDNILPDHIQELVLAAVGQTRLLMTKKLQQFSSLIELCASGQTRAEGKVTISDLEGFWDMVFMQVENVDMRFKNLRELRERQWVVEEKPETKKKPPVTKKKAAATAGPGAPSKIRAMIEAARKAAMQNKNSSSMLLTQKTADNKHFEAGFFCVKSPVRDCRASTNTPRSNRSMLQDVLSSEARRATSVNQGSASRAMMKASCISKAMDGPILKDEISPRLSALEINLGATPARSILKTPNNNHAQRSSRKSAKIVLFHTEETERSPSPGAGIREIVITPEKTDKSPLSPVSNKVVTRKQRSLQTPRRQQENVMPSSESPPRRLTRNMRRSILQEMKDSTSLAELPVKTGRRERTCAKNSIHLTQVH